MGFDIAAAAGGAGFLGDLFGAGAATAAEVAPEVAAVAPEVAATGAEIAPFASGADVLAAGGTDVLGLGGLGDATAGGALGLGADAATGFGADAAGALGGQAALGALPDFGTVAPTIGATAQSAGGVLPASGALPLAGSPLDVTQISGGGGLEGLTGGGQQFAANASGGIPDVNPIDAGYGGLGQATNLANAANNVLPASQSLTGDAANGGVDLNTASLSSGVGGGGSVQGDVLPPQASSTTYTAPAGGGVPQAPGGGGGGGGGAGGGGGGFDYWKAAGLGLAAAPLAITLARGQQQMPQQGLASEQYSNIAGGAGAQLLQQAMQGQVTPGQQASLTLNRQQMINQARQQLYNQGIQNPEASSAWGGIVANIDQQIAIQQQQFLTANINEAFTGTGQAQQNLTNLAQQQVALDNAYTQAIAGATGSLGRLVGQTGTRLL